MPRTTRSSPQSAMARLCALLGSALILTGCGTSLNRAPIEDRGQGGRPGAATAGEAAVRVLPGAENAGKPGYYAVRPGDTMARIALDNGQNWRDVARWNNIENPNVLEVGQILRVLPPVAEGAVARAVTPGARVESRPLDPARPGGVVAPAVAASAPAAAPAAPVVAPAAPSVAVKEGDDDVNWLWPSSGTVLANFDESRNVKGLVLGGRAGDPVLAAADGRVVYAGSGLRSYGNLVIVKHNSTYLTAYAHNQALLVKEDQLVRRGQRIAEMGSSDAERVQLHFEIRRLGKPIDPTRLLPPR